MDSSEDAENINHLQCYEELQVIASAVGQRTHGLQSMVSKGKSQQKHIYHSEAEKKDRSEPPHESVRLQTGGKGWTVKVGSSSSLLARRGLKQR